MGATINYIVPSEQRGRGMAYIRVVIAVIAVALLCYYVHILMVGDR